MAIEVPTNIYFNGEMDDAVTIKTIGTIKHLIKWSDLSTREQTEMTAMINVYGGVVPFVSAVAAQQTIDFGGTGLGGNATGLSIDDTSGTQVANFGGTVVGGNATGLLNDATVYTATITIDSVAKPIAVTGSLAQTFTTLVSEIQTDVGAAGTVSIVGGNILVESATAGTLSTVSMVDGTLFAAVTGFVSFDVAVDGTAGGPELTATITIDGVPIAINVNGDVAQTFTTLVSEIQIDVGAAGTVSIVGGNILVVSATTGAGSSVSTVDGNLFVAVTGFVDMDLPYVSVADFEEALIENKFSNGSPMMTQVVALIRFVGDKPLVGSNKTTDVYWDGTNWLRVIDDVVVV